MKMSSANYNWSTTSVAKNNNKRINKTKNLLPLTKRIVLYLYISIPMYIATIKNNNAIIFPMIITILS